MEGSVARKIACMGYLRVVTYIWHHVPMATLCARGRDSYAAIPRHDKNIFHFSDVIMSVMASQITGVSIVC